MKIENLTLWYIGSKIVEFLKEKIIFFEQTVSDEKLSTEQVKSLR